MLKKIFSILLILVVCSAYFFSCKKYPPTTSDPTRNFFPLTFGQYVTYDVDSIYYLDSCQQYEIKSQLKYVITDTTRDKNDSVIYILNVFTRQYDGDIWQSQGYNVALSIRANADSICVTQDGNTYTKMKFPVTESYNWAGNYVVQYQIPTNAYLQGWNYQYQKLHLPFNDNLHNYQNTVTVLEDDESVNYPSVDSAVPAYRTYAKEVYAYNIGMIYKEWTHWTYSPNSSKCVKGYTVIMRAVDHN